jgi:hypothetical protein
MTFQTRRKIVKQRKGILLPIEDRGKPDFISGGYKYYGGAPYSKSKAIRQTILGCHYCGNEATFTAIFDRDDGCKQVERLCGACSKIHGPISLKLKVVS